MDRLQCLFYNDSPFYFNDVTSRARTRYNTSLTGAYDDCARMTSHSPELSYTSSCDMLNGYDVMDDNAHLHDNTTGVMKLEHDRAEVKSHCVTRSRRKRGSLLTSSHASDDNNNADVSSTTGAPTAKLTREQKRRLRRATFKYRSSHAQRERLRVQAFNVAFQDLRKLLPVLPPDKKLSKIEILKFAISYIKHLSQMLEYDTYRTIAC